MIGVSDFVDFVEKSVFPAQVESLRKCQTAEDVGLWRKALVRDVYSRQVEGESLEQLLALRFNTKEEESKDELKMSERVFLAAKGLEDDQKLAERQFEIDKA